MSIPTIYMRVISALLLAPVVIAAVWYGGLAFYLMALAVFLISVREWVTLSIREGRLHRGILAAGIAYIFIFCATGVWLREHEVAGLYLLLYVLFAIWACDSCAYASGKLIGGPKMAPKISPNKTWAGLIGGAAGSAIADTVFTAFFMRPDLEGLFIQTMPLWAHALLGIFLAVVGQAGDLLVSLLKRRCGLKDTGRIIPGHGGLLDRIDSLLLAVPVFAFIVFVLEALR